MTVQYFSHVAILLEQRLFGKLCHKKIEETSNKFIDKTSKMPILELEAAKSTIREIIQSPQGVVFPTRHCKDRMEQRNVQMDDILHFLFWGTVELGQESEDAERNVFPVSGTDIEGEPLVVVVEIIEEENRLNCISVF
jgi:hypothetical protein